MTTRRLALAIAWVALLLATLPAPAGARTHETPVRGASIDAD